MSRGSRRAIEWLYRAYVIAFDRADRRRVLDSKGTNKPNGILMTPREHRLVHRSK